MEHASLPWRINDTYSTLVETENRRIIASTATTSNQSTIKDNANAAFIVRACNCHDELVRALEACLPSIKADAEASHLTDGFRNVRNSHDDVLEFVESALKLAKAF